MPPKMPLRGDPNSQNVRPDDLIDGKEQEKDKKKKRDPKDEKRRRELLLQSAKMESGMGQTEGDKNAFAPNNGLNPANRGYPLPCSICGRDHFGPACFE